MSDEQTIYISPEDDLTTVRERLEHIPTRQVTLVIPAQTQLRSHVAWKLLYARARELNKEVLIVSSDPQVRSVAHAVKFKVAHSLEANQVTRSRPFSRPTRSSSTGRTKSTRATSPNKGRSTNALRAGQQPSSRSLQKPASERPQASANFAATPYQEEQDIEQLETINMRDIPEKPEQYKNQHYGQSYDYRIERSPAIRPLSADQIEEPDLLLEDYALAQDIRQAASGGQSKPEQKQVPPTPRLQPEQDDKREPTKKPRKKQDNSSDIEVQSPFSTMDEPLSAPDKEQHGGVVIEDLDTNEHQIQPVSDAPNSIIDNEIEIQSDQDDILPDIPQTPPATREPWNTSAHKQEKQGEEKRPRRDPGTRQRSTRTGYIRSPQVPPEDEEQPIEDRATSISPRSRLGSEPQETSSRSSLHNPDPVELPIAARDRQRGPVSYGRTSTSLRSGNLRPAGERPTNTLRGPGSRNLAPKKRWHQRSILIWTILIVVLLLVIGLGAAAFFVPTADATLSVNARDYTHTVALITQTNSTTSQLPSHMMTQTFTQKGTENATGSKLIGKAKSHGNVCFSNESNNSVEIPTGTIVTTFNGNVQFTTTADVVTAAHYSCASDPLPDPVQAVNSGESGNVPAGSVSAIPDSTLTTIAQLNKVKTTDLKLSVINTDSIGGGGMQPLPSVTDQDLANAKQDLHKQLQNNINQWLDGFTKNGYTGKLTTIDTLISAPAKDTIIEDGTKSFQAEIKVVASVLYVKKSDLQKATINQLDTDINNDKTYNGYAILRDDSNAIQLTQLRQESPDASTLKFTFQATAKAARDIQKDFVQNLIKGKTPVDAEHQLASIPGVNSAHVTVQPGFVPWITPWTEHINVKIIPATKTGFTPPLSQN